MELRRVLLRSKDKDKDKKKKKSKDFHDDDDEEKKEKFIDAGIYVSTIKRIKATDDKIMTPRADKCKFTQDAKIFDLALNSLWDKDPVLRAKFPIVRNVKFEEDFIECALIYAFLERIISKTTGICFY